MSDGEWLDHTTARRYEHLINAQVLIYTSVLEAASGFGGPAAIKIVSNTKDDMQIECQGSAPLATALR